MLSRVNSKAVLSIRTFVSFAANLTGSVLDFRLPLGKIQNVRQRWSQFIKKFSNSKTADVAEKNYVGSTSQI